MMTKNKFLHELSARALQIEETIIIDSKDRNPEKKIRLLLSGGSTSTLMLLVFLELQKENSLKIPIEAIYLQFDNYIWLEREALRNLTNKLQIPLLEVQISEVSVTSSPRWKISNKLERQDLVWTLINESITTKMVCGCGWTQYLRIANDLSVAGKEICFQTNSLNNLIDFYTPQIWKSLLELDQAKIFFQLWTQIPFHSMRYWQDYIFQNLFNDFKPCRDYQLENFL